MNNSRNCTQVSMDYGSFSPERLRITHIMQRRCRNCAKSTLILIGRFRRSSQTMDIGALIISRIMSVSFRLFRGRRSQLFVFLFFFSCGGCPVFFLFFSFLSFFSMIMDRRDEVESKKKNKILLRRRGQKIGADTEVRQRDRRRGATQRVFLVVRTARKQT